MATENVPQNIFKFYCGKCDYGCSKESLLKRHFKSKKHNAIQLTPVLSCDCGKSYKHSSSYYRHIKICNGTKKVQNGTKEVHLGKPKEFICECGKKYAHHTGLSRHKKNCDFQNNAIISQHSDDDHFQLKLVSTLKQILPHLGLNQNTINNTFNNSNNNSNNRISANQINIFLNEKCADAMTIQQFARNLQFSTSDLLLDKQDSLIKVINENLKPLAVTERPVHCSNIAKRKWYVNDEKEGWKADDGNTLLVEVQHKLIKNWVGHFETECPDWQSVAHLQDNYIRIVSSTTKVLEPKEQGRVLTHIGENITIDRLDLLKEKN